MKVAVTTDRFADTAAAFRTFGLDPVSLPCIRVEPARHDVLTQARLAAARADLLLISSARTVGILWPHGPMPQVGVAAVGKQTASAVSTRGGQVVAVGQSGLAGLVSQLANQFEPARVVFPHAAGSDPVALEALRYWATNLETFEVYRSIPLPPGPAKVEAASFASPSAVEGWLLTRDFEGMVLGVIGATTLKAIVRYRVPEVVAPEPTYLSLARAMASFLQVSR